jgi:hypothetical protein
MQAIWQAVHAHALSPHIPSAAFEACAALLGAIAQRQLAPLPPGFHTLWGLPLLQHPPSQALLEFAAAALQSGSVKAPGLASTLLPLGPAGVLAASQPCSCVLGWWLLGPAPCCCARCVV